MRRIPARPRGQDGSNRIQPLSNRIGIQGTGTTIQHPGRQGPNSEFPAIPGTTSIEHHANIQHGQAFGRHKENPPPEGVFQLWISGTASADDAPARRKRPRIRNRIVLTRGLTNMTASYGRRLRDGRTLGERQGIQPCDRQPILDEVFLAAARMSAAVTALIRDSYSPIFFQPRPTVSAVPNCIAWKNAESS